jgi:hypothetical protein
MLYTADVQADVEQGQAVVLTYADKMADVQADVEQGEEVMQNLLGHSIHCIESAPFIEPCHTSAPSLVYTIYTYIYIAQQGCRSISTHVCVYVCVRERERITSYVACRR